MKHKAKQVIKIIATNVSLLYILSSLFTPNNANAQCNASSNSWCLLGNSGTTVTNYIGTIDAQPLIFKTTETEWMRITPSGNLGIFTIAPAYKLDVVGDINLTGALRIATVAGNFGQVLTSAAGGANTWTTPTTGTVTSITAGTGLIGNTITTSGTIALSIPVSIANGGTNTSSIGTAGSVIYSNGTQHASTAVGTSGQVLTSSGAGTPTWITPTTGTVTSVTGIAPIISTGGATPAILITQADASNNGFLSSTDWNIFNNKVTGSGTLNYLPKWTPNGSTLGNSSIFDNGNVGIGTTSPQANLEVKNGNVLFDGTTGNTPVNGAGTRIMWVPSKAAFRAGVVTGNTWDNANIGTSSVAFGINTTAESYACFVVGRYNRISASYSKTTWVPTDPLFVIGNGQDSQKTGNALTVLKNGNVGIGTPTPINRFDVSGEIAIGGGYAGSKVAPVNGAIIRGIVGIGTATPTQKLEVNGNVSVTGVNSTLLFGQEAVSAGNWGQWGIEYDNANHGLNFWKPFGSNNFGNAFLFIKDDGNVGIGTNLSNNTYDATYKLAVNGKIRAKKVVVNIGWSDFVFEKNYKLYPLSEIEKYIIQNGHLPEIPSAKEVETNGGDLGELVKLQMQKIEELTLYLIDQNKKVEQMQKELDVLKAEKK